MSWTRPPAAAIETALQIVLATGLFAALVWLSYRHNVRFDLTPEKSHVLSDHARQVAERITEPVRITFFYSSQESAPRREMADLLEQFRAVCPTLTYELLDLDRNPRAAQRLHIASYNTGVVEMRGRTVLLRGIDEEGITGALLELTQEESKTVCFVTGHGERSPMSNDERSGYSDVGRALERENYAVRVRETVPDMGTASPCDVSVMAGPRTEWLPGEAEGLLEHLQRGGRVLLLLDPGAPIAIVDFLRSLGVEAANDLVVDERNRFLGADSFTPRVPIFDQGTFGNRLDAAAVFSLARTVRPLEENAPSGARVSLLALSSDDSWALTNPPAAPDAEVQFRKGIDRAGPLPMGAMVTFAPFAGSQSGQLMVFGDSDFASNFYVNLLGNRDLFLSSIAVLAAEPELVAVRKKGMTRGTISPIVLTAEQGRSIFWTVVVAEPAVFLFVGLLVAVRRRRRRGGR